MGQQAGGTLGIRKKRRNSESDMPSTHTRGVAMDNRSFVVLRGNSRPSCEALEQAAAVDRHGSIVESRSLGVATDRGLAQGSHTILIPNTPIPPDEDGMPV